MERLHDRINFLNSNVTSFTKSISRTADRLLKSLARGESNNIDNDTKNIQDMQRLLLSFSRFIGSLKKSKMNESSLEIELIDLLKFISWNYSRLEGLSREILGNNSFENFLKKEGAEQEKEKLLFIQDRMEYCIKLVCILDVIIKDKDLSKQYFNDFRQYPDYQDLYRKTFKDYKREYLRILGLNKQSYIDLRSMNK